MTTVREIIIAHLRSIGADGLCCDDCGCGTNDFPACAGWGDPSNCVPAKKITATEAGEYWEAGEEIFVPMEQEDAT